MSTPITNRAEVDFGRYLDRKTPLLFNFGTYRLAEETGAPYPLNEAVVAGALGSLGVTTNEDWRPFASHAIVEGYLWTLVMGRRCPSLTGLEQLATQIQDTNEMQPLDNWAKKWLVQYRVRNSADTYGLRPQLGNHERKVLNEEFHSAFKAAFSRIARRLADILDPAFYLYYYGIRQLQNAERHLKAFDTWRQTLYSNILFFVIVNERVLKRGVVYLPVLVESPQGSGHWVPIPPNHALA